jgi:hypothetical protein
MYFRIGIEYQTSRNPLFRAQNKGKKAFLDFYIFYDVNIENWKLFRYKTLAVGGIKKYFSYYVNDQ